ncbi:MAG: hypothetical protein ABMA15_30080, partial [Vicinamibacterales bacterium]
MKFLILGGLLAFAGLAQSAGTQTFSGTITESECSTGNHALMRMGDTDAECAQACVDAHGALYLLYDGKVSYQLSDQKAP